MIYQFVKTIQFFRNHPLASKHIVQSIIIYLSWQLKTLFSRKPFKIKWLGNSSFYMKKGDHGLTGNYYTGLLDFREMSFMLHFLRSDDMFIDIGANLGAYTILASAISKAKTHAFEPIPSSFFALSENIKLNGLNERVELHNVGVSNQNGSKFFSFNNDTTNHVVEKVSDSSLKIDVVQLDDVVSVERSCLIKIDVEGFEYFVLQGAKAVLKNPNVKGIIVELNSSGRRYGIADHEIDSFLRSINFCPYGYEPFMRSLFKLKTFSSKDNTIYLRDIPFIVDRITSAEKIVVRGTEY